MDQESNNNEDHHQTKYKGVRRRKWGKWVSEIRVPGSQARLWLGSYSTPEAAAVAHDVAFYCLRRPDSLDSLNFPLTLPISALAHVTSPSSVQRAASDAGLAVDAHFSAPSYDSPAVTGQQSVVSGQDDVAMSSSSSSSYWSSSEAWGISVDDYL